MSAEPAARPPRAHWLVWLFAAVGLIGIVGVIALVAMVMSFERPYQPAKVASDRKTEIVFTVGTPQDLPGTDLLHLDVSASEGRGGSSPYSGGRDDRRNILLLDKATGASRRILPDNMRRIEEARFLPAKAQIPDDRAADSALIGTAEADERAPAAYYLLEVQQAERSELKDVLVGTLSGGRQGFVMRGLDGIDSVWMQSPTRIGLIVRERLGLYFRIVDIPTLKVVQSRRIEVD